MVNQHKETLVGVVTSEKTWIHLQKYCFNDKFIVNRHHFDLAVVFNGYSSEGINYVKQYSPEFLLVRPNVGFDPAAFDYLIKNTPIYNESIFLHDDHWFNDENWFDSLKKLIQLKKDVDVFGNLVKATFCKSQFFQMISAILGYEEYQPENFPCFIQGMAGMFRRNAIETLLKLDGIPHIHRNIKEVGFVCERIFSFILLKEGFKFAQIPPGYEKYLMHRDYSHNPDIVFIDNEKYNAKTI